MLPSTTTPWREPGILPYPSRSKQRSCSNVVLPPPSPLIPINQKKWSKKQKKSWDGLDQQLVIIRKHLISGFSSKEMILLSWLVYSGLINARSRLRSVSHRNPSWSSTLLVVSPPSWHLVLLCPLHCHLLLCPLHCHRSPTWAGPISFWLALF